MPFYSPLTKFGSDAEHIKGELRKVVIHVDDQKCSSPYHLFFASHCVSACFTGKKLQNDLVTWLSPPDPFVNYNTASDSRYGDTGVWFIKSNEFKNWKESSSLLWVYGKRTFSRTLNANFHSRICMFLAGAGKSVITYVTLLFILAGSVIF